KVVPPRDLENSSVNVIHSRRLRIHRRVVDCSAVQDIVCDRPVVTLIANVHRRQERGRTQDDDKRDDDDSDPTALISRHKWRPCPVLAISFLKNWIVVRNPPAKPQTGVKPAFKILSTLATECLTSPGRSSLCSIIELDLVSLRMVKARSAIVIGFPQAT